MGMLERPMFSAHIDNAICVNQHWLQDKVECVLLSVKMCAGHMLDPPFEEGIHAAIRMALSKRPVPAYIFKGQELSVGVCG